MNRIDYIKAHNLKEISLVIASILEDDKIGINYQALNTGSFLVLSKDINFNKFDVIYPKEHYWDIKDYDFAYKDNNPFYELGFISCSIILDNLDLNTRYYYKICGKEYEGKTRTFLTNQKADNFSFYSYVDFQHGNNDVTHNLIKNLKDIKKCDLMLCSGDLSGTSAKHSEWTWLFDESDAFDDVLFSSAVGDHEYWAKYEVHASEFKDPIPYMNIMINPNNGPEELKNRVYYYLYNNVLFVFLDTQDSDTVENDNIEAQITWFKKIVEENKNKYDYLCVYMHKSIYGSFENDTRVRKMMRLKFYPLFDSCNVDIVFSGHDHRYSRSYPLRNDKVDENGTVYLDLGSSGNKRRSYEEAVDKDGLHAKVVKVKEDELAIGAIVDVNSNNMTINIYDQHKNKLDYLSINKKKR